MDLVEYKLVKEKSFQRHPWELTRLRFLRFLVNRLTRKKNIADIGSGDGFLAAGIATAQPAATITAVDINYTSDILALLNEQKPVNLWFTNELNEIPADTPTDAIILMDVLEHVEQPGLLLEKICKHPSVNKETVFIITVPAWQQLFSVHDKNLGHYRRYNLRQLGQLLSGHSLKMEESGYFFNSLLPVRFLQKMVEKKEAGHQGDSIHNWKGGTFLTGLISTFFWAEFKITWYLAHLGIKIPGLTCYCICRHSPL
jgi:hypothetical protein